MEKTKPVVMKNDECEQRYDQKVIALSGAFGP